MRKNYLDNIRWMTIVLVIVYHVVYMFNGIVTMGVIGPFSEKQYQDGIQYILYPWFMNLLLLFRECAPSMIWKGTRFGNLYVQGHGNCLFHPP